MTLTREPSLSGAVHHRHVAALLVVTAAWACTARPTPESATPPTVYDYMCPDGFRLSASFSDDTAVLALPDRTARLPQVIAASGVRYASADTTFWIKGRTARLELGGTTREDCSTSSNF